MIKILLLALLGHGATDVDSAKLKRAEAHLQELLLGKAIVKEAERHLGEPYVWGGIDGLKDGGLDCSGFTSTVLRSFGIPAPYSAMDQFRGGIGIERPALAPGDLVFFLGSPMHVGIYAGNGEMIHAPGKGKTVSRASFNKSYFATRYAGARRYRPTPKKKESKP